MTKAIVWYLKIFTRIIINLFVCCCCFLSQMYFLGRFPAYKVCNGRFCYSIYRSIFTFELMKSQAISFSSFRVSVDTGTATISRMFPNWNRNVTSGPSILTERVKQWEKMKSQLERMLIKIILLANTYIYIYMQAHSHTHI